MSRLASTIDTSLPSAQQKPVTTVAALTNPARFTLEQVKDEATLTQRLNAFAQSVDDNTKVARSHPEQAPLTFDNVACGASGKVRLAHNLGRFADFIVVKWSGSGTTAGPGLVSDENDASGAQTDGDTLWLKSSVAGTAKIRVY